MSFEFKKILNNNKFDIKYIKESFVDWQKNRFGFFDSFVDHNGFNGSDFTQTLFAPVTVPVGFAIATVIAATTTILASAIGLISLIVAGGAAAFGDDSTKNDALEWAGGCGIVFLLASAAALFGAFATFASAPVAAAHLFTRSGATIHDAYSYEDPVAFSNF